MTVKRSLTSTICQEPDLLISHEDWAAIFEPALCKDSAAAESLAHLLFTIKQVIDNGPDGAEQASRVLLAGIESAYLYTDAHSAALKLYLLFLTGHLKPPDEPLQLINEAIKRGTTEVELGNKRMASEKNQD